MVCSQYLLNLLFLSINLLSICSVSLQYIFFLNLTTPVEVMAKVYFILDHPSYMPLVHTGLLSVLYNIRSATFGLLISIESKTAVTFRFVV